MTARVLIVKNIGREGPGLLRDALMQHHIQADVVELDRGEIIPSLRNYQAMFVLGGPASANDSTSAIQTQIERAQEAISSELPYLGICLGHQILGKAAGAAVTSAIKKEVGFFDETGARYHVDLTDVGQQDPLFEGVPRSFLTFQLHGDTVQPVAGVEVLALSTSAEVQAIRVGRHAYGLQMHLELVPEMLAVWGAQDADLKGSDSVVLQQQFSDASASYIAVGKRVFENFLRIADLTSAIDLTEEQARAR